ncbi:hypothetical protein N656DRAFT_784598 [Canariomyces notabilis]|uniref:Uncharacterized protein n=1 Tax=Canariomyces notabilis TaxID=2074819 RepID=A0AAN6QD70_9PEZI|nr:hypothetical protein N656DRAFT_784598 [Canariomyces arenarius]
MAAATEQNPKRLFLVSIPRTASNLFVKVINILNQPNVFTNEKAGYFFYPALVSASAKNFFNTPLDKWTDEMKTEMRQLYQQCFDNLEAASAEARDKGKLMFTKEHAFWFVNPAFMLEVLPDPSANGSGEVTARSHQESFRLTMPEAYGPSETFSPLNKTLLSDEYLRTWQFAFLIRHPALAWPSMYRAMMNLSSKLHMMDEDGIKGAMLSNMTWKWTRYLFDWCREQSGGSTVPLVLDAHDVIHNQEVVLQFCDRAGLDRSAVQFEWDDGKQGVPSGWTAGKQNGESGGPDGAPDVSKEAAKIMTSTLVASKGIIKDKAPAAVDIDAEVEKWKAEFGPEAAGLIEKTVRDAMPDYEYLREFRLKV